MRTRPTTWASTSKARNSASIPTATARV
jgi:hypothetical protein